MLFLIQLSHTLITFFIYACIFYVISAGLTRRRGRLLLWAHVIVVAEGVILLVNGFRCPFRTYVDRAYDVYTSDMFLPHAVAEWVAEAGAVLFIFGLALTIRNSLQHRWRPADASPSRVLFLAEGQLGDLLLLTPALRAVKRTYPSSHVSVLIVERHMNQGPDSFRFDDLSVTTEQRTSSVLGTNPHVDELLIVNRKALRSLPGVARARAEWGCVMFLRRRKYDTVICTFNEDRFALWAYLSGAYERVGQRKQGLHWLLTTAPDIDKAKGGVLEYYCDLVRSIGTCIDSLVTEYTIPESSIRWADRLLESLGIAGDSHVVAIHPGASGDYRVWPAERYAGLIERLNGHGVRILLCTGGQDSSVISAITASLRSKVIEAEADKVSDLAAVLQRSTLCISNDSGPRHLAIAVGTPSLALCRKFHDREWGIYPPSESRVILKGNQQCPVCPLGVCLDKIPEGETLGSYCMRMIEVEEVVARVREMVVEHKENTR
jgi:ADP-heptose:LPS heptosyltransferase